MKIKRFFTLVELIVVIVTIGILALVVTPNISNIKQASIETSIDNNTVNIQTAVDTIKLKENSSTYNNIKIGEPKEVDFDELVPKHLRNKPKHGKYWVDHNGIVFGTEAGLPKNIGIDEDGMVTWQEAKDAAGYQVYKEDSKVKSAASGVKLIPLPDGYIEKNDTGVYKYEGEAGVNYFVSSEDSYGNFTPAITAEYLPTINKLELGDYVYFGTHLNGEPLLWNVVKKESDKVMLFMTEPLRDESGNYLEKPFNSNNSNNYANSEIRQWLNNEFIILSSINSKLISKTTIDYAIHERDLDFNTKGDVPHSFNNNIENVIQNYDVAYKNTVTDKVFLINIPELVYYINPTLSSIGESYYSISYLYWTRDSDTRDRDSYVRDVSRSGNIGGLSSIRPIGNVRAAVNISSGVLTSGKGTKENPYIIK